MGDFAGRVAIVTGAGGGIGAACAARFASLGASVVLLDLDGDALDRESHRLPDSAETHTLDITDRDAVDEIVRSVAARYGAINHLVNNAASFIAAGADATQDDWQRSLSVNVIASAMLTAKASEHMPPGSSVVNISSISAHAAQTNRWTYNATKAAILALTRGQALDFADRGIRVNAVSPGWIWTNEVLKAAGDDPERWGAVWGEFHMLRRLGTPDEIAGPVVFLSGPEASFITGAELLVDGGYSAMGPEGLGQQSRFAGTD